MAVPVPPQPPGSRRPWWTVVPAVVAAVLTLVVVAVAVVRLATADAGDGAVCVTCRDTEAVTWPMVAVVALAWAVAIVAARLGARRRRPDGSATSPGPRTR